MHYTCMTQVKITSPNRCKHRHKRCKVTWPSYFFQVNHNKMFFPSVHVRTTRYKFIISTFQHSQCTIIATSLATGLPMPLSAVHLYSPSSCLPLILKGKVTELLSETLVQVMFGVGLPSALQVRSTKSLSFTVCLPRMSLMTGGAVGSKQQT